MTIGELFISLGFKIDGDAKLVQVEREVTRTTGSVTKLAIEVAAMSAAFLYMIETSLKAATALRSFQLTTGLSTAELQAWQHAAVVNGLTAGDLTEAVKELQTARTNFALGNPQAVGAWTLLGVDPRQDPFRVLDALRQRLRNVKDEGVARNLLGQVGLENMLPLLRSTNAEWEKWSKNFIVTTEQTAKLAQLNAAWQSLAMSVESVKTQFSSLFVPVLTSLSHILERVAELGAIFVRWLQSSSPLAHALRIGIQFLAIALLALGVALSGLVFVGATLSAVLAFLATGIIGLTIAAAPLLLVITLVVGAIGVLALTIQDLWTALHGGKSFFDWSNEIKMVDLLAKGILKLIDLWDRLKGGAEGALAHALLPGLAAEHASPSQWGHPGNGRQEIHNEIHIHESTSPKATAREVMRSLQDLHRGALNQSPVRSY